jgi:hypothetical protein
MVTQLLYLGRTGSLSYDDATNIYHKIDISIPAHYTNANIQVVAKTLTATGGTPFTDLAADFAAGLIKDNTVNLIASEDVANSKAYTLSAAPGAVTSTLLTFNESPLVINATDTKVKVFYYKNLGNYGLYGTGAFFFNSMVLNSLVVDQLTFDNNDISSSTGTVDFLSNIDASAYNITAGSLNVGTLAGLLLGTAGAVSAIAPVLGDIPYADVTPTWTKLAGNITTTKKFFTQTGTGAVSAVPVWDTILAADIPDLSATYQPLDADLTQIAALSNILGDLLYTDATPEWNRLAGNTTATKKFLVQTGTGAISAVPSWDTLIAGDIPDISATYALAGHTHAGVYEPHDDGLTSLAGLVYASAAFVKYTGADTFTLDTTVYLSTESDPVAMGYIDQSVKTTSDVQFNKIGLGGAVDATYRFKLYSTDASDYVQMYHDNTNAYFTTSDGSIVLQTVESTASPVYVDIMGGGASGGYAYIRLYHETNRARYGAISQIGGDMYLSTTNGNLRLFCNNGAVILQDGASNNVQCFTGAASGETRELLIYGYRAADSLRSLEISVGIDAADTASFDGLSNYQFDGNIIVTSTNRTYYNDTASSILHDGTGLKLIDDARIWLNCAAVSIGTGVDGDDQVLTFEGQVGVNPRDCTFTWDVSLPELVFSSHFAVVGTLNSRGTLAVGSGSSNGSIVLYDSTVGSTAQISTGTTYGAMLGIDGTEKLGFWGVTPRVQPSPVEDAPAASGFDLTGTDTVNKITIGSMFDTIVDQLNLALQALRDIGILDTW